MQKQLADGLILRTLSEGIASDREGLPHFYAVVNGEGEPEGIVEGLTVWTQDLINDHPLTSHDDIFVVVDPAHNDRIVSATLLIPQTWSYEEIPIAIGRPELVGTLPEYRGRGLVRALFDAVHERSAALGHQMQVITGIPYFYRQFGYTMALGLDSSASFPLHVPTEPAPDYTPAFTLRAATTEDVADISRWHSYLARERLVTEVRSLELWQYEIAGHSPRSLIARSYQIIVNAEGKGVGYIELGSNLYRKALLFCAAYVVGDEASYLATFRDVMRGVKLWALATFGECPPLLLFATGSHDALYTLVDRYLGGVARPHSYKWFVRVADAIAFLQSIQPVLERRLEGSGAHRYTGDLKIGFHNVTGIALKFEHGRLIEITPMKALYEYDAIFPWHLFWNVVLGDQSPEELNAALPDVEISGGKAMVLLNTLFPKKKSWVEGLA